MDGPAISVRGLRKRYGAHEAVRGVDFEVAPGEVFGLLGPNGAGKTTTVEILEGYRPRSAGEVSVLGADPAHPTREWRRRVGLVLQECELDTLLTVRETLTLFASFYPRPRPAAEVIDLVGLAAKADARIGTLSGGQKRRADVAVALVGAPELVFLDEPTTGFDPSARREAWSMIEGLKATGTTVVLTTHYLDEAQHLADRVAIMRDGALVAEGRPDDLARGRRTRIAFRPPPGTGPDDVRAATGLEPRAVGATLELEVDDPQEPLRRLTTWAHDAGLRLEGLEAHRPTLEDVFLDLTAEDAT